MTPGEQQAKSQIYGHRGLWVIATSYGSFGVFDNARRWLCELSSPADLAAMLVHAAQQPNHVTQIHVPLRAAPISSEGIDF